GRTARSRRPAAAARSAGSASASPRTSPPRCRAGRGPVPVARSWQPLDHGSLIWSPRPPPAPPRPMEIIINSHCPANPPRNTPAALTRTITGLWREQALTWDDTGRGPHRKLRRRGLPFMNVHDSPSFRELSELRTAGARGEKNRRRKRERPRRTPGPFRRRARSADQRVPGKAQDPLADLVAGDLGGAAGDGQAAGTEAQAARGRAEAVGEGGVRARERGEQVGRGVGVLGEDGLGVVALGAGLAARDGALGGPQVQQPEGLLPRRVRADALGRPGDAVAALGVQAEDVGPRRAADAAADAD